jgi:hypothetical protein
LYFSPVVYGWDDGGWQRELGNKKTGGRARQKQRKKKNASLDFRCVISLL